MKRTAYFNQATGAGKPGGEFKRRPARPDGASLGPQWRDALNGAKMIAFFLALGMAAATWSQAPALAHDTSCTRVSMGLLGEMICPPPLGGLMTDINGITVCGPGFCARDSYGKVSCSSQPGGAAVVDSNGKVLCVGGCVDGATSYCVAPRL